MTAAWINSSNDYFPNDQKSDPFAMTMHFITDPEGSNDFRNLTTPLVKWCDPSFQLFNIAAERSRASECFNSIEKPDAVAPLCVLLLLDEKLDSELISELQDYLSKPPWQHHHTSDMLHQFTTCHPNEQHFYSSALDTPLWAVRQVHCGRRFVRFMIYSSANTFLEMINFYTLILNKDPTFKRDNNFCIFTVHTKSGCDIQFAVKKTPERFNPRPLNSAFLQFKVRNIDKLMDNLPNACSPISSHRLQTTDPDGNVTLLLVTKNESIPILTPRRTSIDVLQSLLSPTKSKSKRFVSNKKKLESIEDTDL
ncbi:protein FAM124A-like isoform X2 [Antedon mediterranea]